MSTSYLAINITKYLLILSFSSVFPKSRLPTLTYLTYLLREVCFTSACMHAYMKSKPLSKLRFDMKSIKESTSSYCERNQLYIGLAMSIRPRSRPLTFEKPRWLLWNFCAGAGTRLRNPARGLGGKGIHR